MKRTACGVGAFVLTAAAGLAAAQPGGVDFYTNRDAFLQGMHQDGKVLKGVEDFEEGIIPPGGKVILPDFFHPHVPNYDPATHYGFPNGLSEDNIHIQTNMFPGPTPPHPMPFGGPDALYLIGPGFIGSNSNKVGEDLFLQGIHASLDLIFTPAEHTGIGLELSRFAGFPNGGWIISVYDFNDVPVGVFQVPPPPQTEPFKSFFGFWYGPGIGRINIFDMAGPAPDAVDNIEMWVPAPGAVGLLLAGLPLAGRRRR